MVHAEQLGDEEPREHRQLAMTALRVTYGQGAETLLALLAATCQVPTFPLGWLLNYYNPELRSVVSTIHSRSDTLACVFRQPSWEALSKDIHAYLPAALVAEKDLVARFARFWSRLAEQFLDPHFEPEYNNLNHGMRSTVGGFAISLQASAGSPNAEPRTPFVSQSEYGSSFWSRPRRLDGTHHTFELHQHVSRSWSSDQFVLGLQLIGTSIRNISSRLMIHAGIEPSTVQFSWPNDPDAFEKAWHHDASVHSVLFSQGIQLAGSFDEITAAAIRGGYGRRDNPDVKPEE